MFLMTSYANHQLVDETQKCVVEITNTEIFTILMSYFSLSHYNDMTITFVAISTLLMASATYRDIVKLTIAKRNSNISLLTVLLRLLHNFPE